MIAFVKQYLPNRYDKTPNASTVKSPDRISQRTVLLHKSRKEYYSIFRLFIKIAEILRWEW
jgi:hypothetical protein